MRLPCLATVLILAAGHALALTNLAPGRPETVTLAPRDVARFETGAQAGDYVAGYIETGPGAATVDLLSPEGTLVRRLVTDGRGRSEFGFVAETAGSVIAVTAPTSVTARLGVTMHLPAPSDTPRTPEYLSPRMADLATRVAAGEATDAFWAEVAKGGTPLVEPGPDGQAIVTFLYRGARRTVHILGSPSGSHDEMTRLPGSDVWYRSYLAPLETRLSYQLVPDPPVLPGPRRDGRAGLAATAQADPLNRHPWPADAVDRFARKSTLTLPKAPPQPWLEAGGAPAGARQDIVVASDRLGNERTVTICRPAGFDPARPDTLLLFVFDGREYQSKIPTPAMLDAMIAAGVLPPTVAVFVANPSAEARGRELPGNPVFADFMAEELLPRILSETGLRPDAARTILAGSSYGGLAAVTIAFRHPERFGNAISLSGSFWWHPPDGDPASPNHVAAMFARSPRLPLRVFLSAGQFEKSHPEFGRGILENSRHLRDVLIARGYETAFRDYAAGHDFYVWRGALADGLMALFGRKPAP